MEDNNRASWLDDPNLDHDWNEYYLYEDKDMTNIYSVDGKVEDLKTKAQQIYQCIIRLIHEWFNNGGVYDNSEGFYCGKYAVNSYGTFTVDYSNPVYDQANWLSSHVPGTTEILDQIIFCQTENDYERLLYKLSQYCWSKIKDYDNIPVEDNILSCSGKYYFDRRIPDYEDDEETEYYIGCYYNI